MITGDIYFFVRNKEGSYPLPLKPGFPIVFDYWMPNEPKWFKAKKQLYTIHLSEVVGLNNFLNRRIHDL